MIGSDSPARRLALALVGLAARLLPAERADWAAAMIAEVRHCDRGRDAVAWAAGCVSAALTERVTNMVKGNLRISTWLAAPEMLVCFAPLTIAFLDAAQALGHSQVWAASSDAALLIVAAVLAAPGPVGLVVAFRLLLTGTPIGVRWLRAALVAGPVVNGGVLIAQALGSGVPGSLQTFEFWSALILLSALPALGAAHLNHFPSMVPEVGVEPTRF